MNKFKVHKIIVTIVLIFSIIVINILPSCNVAYAKTSANKIVLEKSKLETYVGKKVNVKINKTKTSKALKNAKFVYTSSYKKIATVNAKGVVTPIKRGNVTITVAIKNNKKVKASCKIKVYSATKQIKLSSKKSYTLTVGDNVK